MEDKSLERAFEVITNALTKDETLMKSIDNMELLINLKHFLDPKKYRNNVKVLKLEQEKDRWRNKDERNN